MLVSSCSRRAGSPSLRATWLRVTQNLQSVVPAMQEPERVDASARKRFPISILRHTPIRRIRATVSSQDGPGGNAMKTLVTQLLMLAVAAVCALGAGSQDGPERVTDGRDQLGKPRQSIAFGVIALLLPPPMTAEDARSWCEDFELPEVTCSVLKEAIAEFAVQERIEHAKIFQRTIDLASALPSVPEIYQSAETLEPLRDVVRERGLAIKRFVALEEGFFAELDSKLAALNLEMIGDSLRQARRISRSVNMRCRLPMAQLSLRAVIRAMRSDRSLAVRDMTEWNAALAGHDHELASLHEQRVMRVFPDILTDVEAFHRFGGDANALVEYRTQTLNGRLRLERAIMAANRRWAEALSQLMEPASSEVFHALVGAALYPALYPNPMELRPLLDQVARLPDQEACKSCLDRLSAETASLEVMAKGIEPEIVALAVSEARGMVSEDDRLRIVAMVEWLQSARHTAVMHCKEACIAPSAIGHLPEWTKLLEACRKYELAVERALNDLPPKS